MSEESRAPNYGARMAAFAVMVIIALGVLVHYQSAGSLPDEAAQAGAAEPEPADAMVPPEADLPSLGNWEYSYVPDAIRGGDMVYASVDSDPDFSPSSYAMKTVFKKQPDGALHADIFSNSPLMCLVSGCMIPVSFDGKSDTLLFSGTSNGIAAMDAEDFVRRVEGAKELIVEVPTAHLGAMQFRFNVEELRW